MYKNLLPRLCVLMISLLSLSQLQAQDGGIQYQYKDFRFPNIDRKALEGSLSLTNGGSLSVVYLPETNAESRGSSFSNNLFLFYSRFRNLEKIQALETLTFNQSFSRNRSLNNSINNPTNLVSGNFRLLPQFQSEYRYYHVPNRFMGYKMNVVTDLGHAFNRNRITQMNSRDSRLAIDVAPGFIFGWGRLEPISDVFLAKFMVDDMKDAGILNQDLTQEELFELGSTMAFVRNQRIFDFRRLRMYELTEIDKWFSQSGLVSNQDFRYFTVLNDNWLYAFRNTRFSGRRTTIGLTPLVQWTDQLGDGSSPKATLGLELSADYQIHKPISQYWQSVFEISGGALFACPGCGDNFPFVISPFASVGQYYGWFPNSRTRVSASGSIVYTPSFQVDQEVLYAENNVMARIGLSADYFVNFQCRINATINYNSSFLDRRNELNSSFDVRRSTNGFQSNLTFSYAFF